MGIEHVRRSQAARIRELADTIASAKKIIAVTGAGISTSCGIPDFRSEDGLYSLIKSDYQHEASKRAREPTAIKGKDLFDASLWKSDTSTSVFYKFIASLRQKVRSDSVKPSPTHRFLGTLRDRRKLIRTYTQNIDGLEGDINMETDMAKGKGSKKRFTKRVLETPSDASRAPGSDLYGGCEIVQLHGELENLRCTVCQKLCSWGKCNEYETTFLTGEAPLCQGCIGKDEDRRNRGCRGVKVGSLRPNIVLYGEENPSADLIAPLVNNDISLQPDLLLVFGTSLKVHGLKVLVKQFAKAVHNLKHGRGKVIFVNLTGPAQSIWKDVIDVWVETDCDGFVAKLRDYRPDIFVHQGQLDFKVQKPMNKYPRTPQKKRKRSDVSVTERTNLGSIPTPDTRQSTKRLRVWEDSFDSDELIRDSIVLTPSKRTKFLMQNQDQDSENQTVADLTKSSSSPTLLTESILKTPRKPLQERMNEPASSPFKGLPTPTSIASPSRKRKRETFSILEDNENNGGNHSILVDRDQIPINEATVSIPSFRNRLLEASGA